MSKRFGVRELGRECGVTGMHISNMEKGKSKPSPELIVKLAAALETDVDEMSHQADQVALEVVGVFRASLKQFQASLGPLKTSLQSNGQNFRSKLTL